MAPGPILMQVSRPERSVTRVILIASGPSTVALGCANTVRPPQPDTHQGPLLYLPAVPWKSLPASANAHPARPPLAACDDE